MAELAPEAPLWAVANEMRQWSASDVERLKADWRSLAALVRPPKGRQGRLIETPKGQATPNQVPNRLPLDSGDLEARLAEAQRELLAMRFSGISTVPLFSQDYPPRLATIENPPLVLYLLGTFVNFERCVAVSGTRTPSQWGSRAAQRLAKRLAQAEWVVTGGLAKGIDTRAHRGALSAPGGKTVAVSALALDRVYPAENLELARQIADRGALVSEHALLPGAGKFEFLRRNRIISGLSFAHFIVETSGTGGTWAQATIAKAQGRPLLALRPPPAETKAMHGFEALVDLGATPCSSVDAAVQQASDAWNAIVA